MDVKSATTKLLLGIARCPIVDACLNGDTNHACSEIVAAQGLPVDEHHVPEPWNGQIESAPLLFVSWNPSWNRRELFPTRRSSDDEIVAFFIDRFFHTDQNSQTWREIRGIAQHILARQPRSGIDYAVTDIVRCKSTRGVGAARAVRECTARYLRPTLDLSGARVIIALGRDARVELAGHFGVPAILGAHDVSTRAGKPLVLALLGAPGSSQSRRLGAADLQLVRRALA